LVFIILGKIFVAIGLFSYFEEFWAVPLGLFVLSAATYFAYPMPLDRFTSAALVLLTSIAALFIFMQDMGSMYVFIWHAFVLVQLVLLGILLTHEKCTYTCEPLIYALVLSLGVSVSTFSNSDSLLQLLNLQILDLSPHLLFYFSALKLMFVFALIFLLLWVAGDWRKIYTKPFIIITIGIIMLGFVTVSGILFGLGILVLGHARHERLLTIFGACFLALFFWNYYYFLPINLMEKAIILVGTGFILLLGRYYILRQDWDKATDLTMPTDLAKSSNRAEQAGIKK